MDDIRSRFRRIAPAADFCSLRLVDERSLMLKVRQDVVQPLTRATDMGAMVTVFADGGMGYGATSDLSDAGLRAAAQRALDWARRSGGRSVVDFSSLQMSAPTGSYRSVVQRPWSQVPVAEKIDLLRTECARLKIADEIVDWETSLWHTTARFLYLTADGGEVEQEFELLVPDMVAIANRDGDTQVRSLGGRGTCKQGGLELLDAIGYRQEAPRIATEALQLLDAPDCPTGVTNLVLAPDQMLLQIHESVGHPLELDRILGDERNYAGTSFVTQDMFGSYRYGSDLMNICYDPSVSDQFATFAFDDDGLPAGHEWIIRHGILQRPIGGTISQARAGMPGVAASRASSWNRPPIDRMANLNMAPGDQNFESLIGQVERGVYLSSNCSWSIDDSRNKFQFGCEWGRLIEDGELTSVVRKGNYRGISATFWRSLVGVGDGSTYRQFGSPWCGKGEPNQVIRVGHASPACLFRDVEVFGGA